MGKKTRKAGKPRKVAKPRTVGKGAENPSGVDPTGHDELDATGLNQEIVEAQKAEIERLNEQLESLREGTADSIDKADHNPAVMTKAYLVTPLGKKAQKAGLVPQRIEYACDAGEAIRQYSAMYVGIGKNSQSVVSEFSYKTELLMDRRPHTEEGILLYDLDLATQSKLIASRKLYYVKNRSLHEWPEKKYNTLEDYRPKHLQIPLSVIS